MARIHRRHPVLRIVLICAAVAALILGGIWAGRIIGFVQDQNTAEDFYVTPDDVAAGSPGDLIASEPLAGAPVGSRAWRVMYHSTDANGTDVPVTGIVVAPLSSGHDLPVVAWAHPTTGAAPECAPSRGFDPFLLVEGLHELLAMGYVVAATDYLGMGLDTPSAYLIGGTEGRNVLDSVRAAQAIPEAGAGDRVVLWGHSQGGQAALFAEQLADSYAPELDVAGVAVAAPAADLTTLLDDDIDKLSGVSIGSYAFTAFAAFYDEDISTILTPAAGPVVPEMVKLCLIGDAAKLHELGQPLVGDFVSSDPSTTPPWSDLLTQNSADPAGGGRPLFIAQGLADELVEPSATAAFVTAACASGRPVHSVTFAGVNHGFVADVALPDLAGWLAALEAGTPAEAGC